MTAMKKPTCALVFALLLSGCGTRSQRETEPEKPSPAVSIAQLAPAFVTVGQTFNVNPKGGPSTLGVSGANIRPNSRMRIGLQVLAADVRQDGTFATAPVPAAIVAAPGKHNVVIEQPDGGLSNTLVFTVLAATGPAPVIDQLFPASTIVGRGFNIQAGGGTAIAMRGSNFLLGAKVLFGSKELDTVFGGENRLSAWVPPALYAAPGVTEVRVRNLDGKLSQPKPFQVKALP
jgi:hypothetical protein